MITWRRHEDGSWGVVGPEGEMHTGIVTVTKRNGETAQVTIERLGAKYRDRFTGRMYQWGVLAPNPRPRQNRSFTTPADRASTGTRRAPVNSIPCAECGNRPGVVEHNEDMVCLECAPANVRRAYLAAQATEQAETAPVAAPVARLLAGSLDVGAFLFAGKAIFTVSTTTERFTFKVSDSRRGRNARPGDNGVFFVSVLSGPNNTADYRYAGIVPVDSVESNAPRFISTRNARINKSAPSVVTFRRLLESIASGALPTGWEFRHEGRCGRCGRTLTVPESIDSGFGPECINLAGLAA